METYLEVLKEIENFLKKKNEKILLIWKILGLVFLGFFFILSYVYCETIGSLVVAGSGLVVLALSWTLIYLGLQRSSETSLGNIRILSLLLLMHEYHVDSLVFSAFELRAAGDTRGKIADLKKIAEKIKTDEVNKLLEEYMKKHNIILEDGERKSIWD